MEKDGMAQESSMPGMGQYRVVGKRQIPEDALYPLNTAQERAAYALRLSAFKQMMATLRPVIRVHVAGEPRVKRFRTLEEANEEALQASLHAAAYLKEKSWKPR